MTTTSDNISIGPAKDQPITVEQLLALPDHLVKKIPPVNRPDLPPGVKLPKDQTGYAFDYYRFLSGALAFKPFPYLYPALDRNNAEQLRRRVRTSISRAAGVPALNVTGSARRSRTQPNPKDAS